MLICTSLLIGFAKNDFKWITDRFLYSCKNSNPKTKNNHSRNPVYPGCQVGLKCCLSKPTMKESVSHQVAEPRKTPSTILAAPIPDKKPASRPLARVRRMLSTLIGPTGAAMEKPISRPRRKTENSLMDMPPGKRPTPNSYGSY